MAVHIKLIKNNIKSSSSYGKYFAKSVSQGDVTLDEIAAEACRNSGFTEGTVVGVVTELQELLKNKLADGQTVAACRTAISSTISARVSKPSGRRASSHSWASHCQNVLLLMVNHQLIHYNMVVNGTDGQGVATF